MVQCSDVDVTPTICTSFWSYCAVLVHDAVVHFMCWLAESLSWSPADLHLVMHGVMCHSPGSLPRFVLQGQVHSALNASL